MPDDVMHFTINKVSNAKRGKSDLATLLPWLRRYKDWLIDRVRINKYKAAFLWEITLSGRRPRTIEQKMQEYARPPEPGSVIVHNESETWKAVQPHIDAGDAEPDGRAIKLMVAMGAGIPEHYLADGQNSNRATAREMSLPTIKKYKRRQELIGAHSEVGAEPGDPGEAGSGAAAEGRRHGARHSPFRISIPTITCSSGRRAWRRRRASRSPGPTAGSGTRRRPGCSSSRWARTWM